MNTSQHTTGAAVYNKDNLTTDRSYDKTGAQFQPEIRQAGSAVAVQHGVTGVATQGLQTQTIETTTTSTATLAPTLQQMPLAINEDVTKEYMPLRNADAMKEIISRMERAALEIDTYAKAKQEMVSKEAVELINEEMLRSKALQDGLNGTLQSRSAAMDQDFARRREAMMRTLDAEKAQQFVNLQTELQKQQEAIMLQSRARIDEITAKAKAKKLEIVHAAQQQHNSMSGAVTDAAIVMQPTNVLNTVSVSKDELRPSGTLSTGVPVQHTNVTPVTHVTETHSSNTITTKGPVMSRDGHTVGKY